jgi:hypothetical protein
MTPRDERLASRSRGLFPQLAKPVNSKLQTVLLPFVPL